MSLNGLDEPQVKEAYEAATAEPGGWFLLKYSSRDEVDLLSRGTGGIVEMRNNISQYEETAPLFGFLKYRRRSVLIRYLPEDCSRLIQARVTVHFNALCEKYTPYHTTFSIATAKELQDSKLSAACSLHAASESTSSSTSSLRRRRLMEIAEEEEEEQQRATKRSSTVLEDGSDDKGNPDDEDDAKTPPASPPPVTLDANLASSPEHSKFAASEEPPNFMGADRPTSSQTVDDGRRLSAQTLRPELYSYASYTYGKPKVKLGPRPSLDVGSSHANPTSGNFRPVSQMPTGFKMYSKGSKRIKSNDQQGLGDSTLDTSDIPFAPASLPITDMSLDGSAGLHSSSDGRPVTSSGVSHKSPTMSTFSASTKNTMTPEKARLMKAMKLREKKKKKQSASEAVSPQSPDGATSPADDTELPRSPDKTEESPGEQHLETLPEEEEKRLSRAKLDSSIVVDASAESLPTDPSESARSDSRPASPLLPSEPEQSTKASSVSESTDETVKESEVEKDAEQAVDDAAETGETKDADAVAAAESEENPQKTAPATEDDTKETVVEVNESSTEEPGTPATAKAETDVQEEKMQEEIQEAIQQGTQLEKDTTTVPPKEPETTAAEGAQVDPPSETINATLQGVKDSVERPPPPGLGLAIPTSKFSTSNPGTPTAAATAFVLPTVAPPPLPDGAAELASSISKTDGVETPTVTTPPKPAMRKPIEPIRTDLIPSDKQSQAPLSEDDELLDELQSATVQEARPMTVSKSPLSPAFPDSSTQPTEAEKESPPHAVRTISNPIRGNLLAPSDVSQSSARSVSAGAAYLHKITQQQTTSRENLTPKNGKLGSNISQRIKALEKLSSNGPENPAPSRSQSTRSNAPSATFFSVNKSREPSRSPSVVDRTSSLTRGSPQRGTGTAVESRDGSPEVRVPRERSGSVASRLSMFEPAIPTADTMPRGRPESISVTARILRDPSQSGSQLDLLKDPSEFNKLELKQSPLEVNHQMADPLIPPEAEEPHKETILERRMSKEKHGSQSENRDEDDGNSRRRSLSIVRDFIKDRRKSLTSSSSEALAAPPLSSAKGSPSRPPSTHNNSGNSLSRRLSISSRRSSISKDAAAGALSPSTMTEASGSGDDSKSTKSDKMKSRAGRFMRRLSSSISSGRGKNLTPTTLSPTVHEEELNADNADVRGVSRGSSVIPPPSTVNFVGDVNVQFPDNLLWKRRTLGLDPQGFLILAATASTTASRDRPATGVKRYHLSEFRGPYTPDVEVQELPNSVVLDFVEGSGIQLACEDRAGQTELLHILQDAHQNHATFGQ